MDKVEFDGKYGTREVVDVVKDEEPYAIDIAVVKAEQYAIWALNLALR